MTTAEDVARNIKFDKVSVPNLISYSILNHANGDAWKEIKLIFNGSAEPRTVNLPKGQWTVVARDGKLKADGMGTVAGGKITVEPYSAFIAAKER